MYALVLYCIPRVRLISREQRFSRLTPEPLFPGPNSGGGGQCSGPVLPVWELKNERLETMVCQCLHCFQIAFKQLFKHSTRLVFAVTQ